MLTTNVENNSKEAHEKAIKECLNGHRIVAGAQRFTSLSARWE
jgi:hypothetical protein